MLYRGEINLSQLCRNQFDTDCYSPGFGTHMGTVAAASERNSRLENKDIVPSQPQSYERLFQDTEHKRFLFLLGHCRSSRLRDEMAMPRLQRAIGVIYHPENELASHYFEARLPNQFDEYIWFDDTPAVTPFKTSELAGMPDTYLFGL